MGLVGMAWWLAVFEVLEVFANLIDSMILLGVVNVEFWFMSKNAQNSLH